MSLDEEVRDDLDEYLSDSNKSRSEFIQGLIEQVIYDNNSVSNVGQHPIVQINEAVKDLQAASEELIDGNVSDILDEYDETNSGSNSERTRESDVEEQSDDEQNGGDDDEFEVEEEMI